MVVEVPPRPVADRPPEPRAHARVDPFVLPSSTTSQFLLLLTLPASIAAFVYDQLFGGPSFWRDDFAACAVQANVAATTTDDLLTVTTYLRCYDDLLLDRVGAGVLGVVVVLGLVGLGVLLHARATIWWDGLQPWDAAPWADRVVDECVAEAGLTHRPTFWLEPFRADLAGRAFGTMRHAHVQVAHLLVLARRDATGRPSGPEEARLRAVVRHELAHVRNRDLALTAMVTVVPWVLLGAVVVPLAVKLALHGRVDLVPYGWRLAVLGALVLLVRASIYRRREHDADVRASLPVRSGEEPFLASAFPDTDADLPTTTGAGRLQAVTARWRRRVGLRTHPATAVRGRVVADPSLLLRAGFAEGAATGVTAGVAFYYLRNLLVGLFDGGQPVAGALAGVGVGALVATVTGQSMWREALAAHVAGRPAPSGLATAGGLAAGLLAAEFLAPSVLSSWLTLLGTSPVVGIAAAAALAAGCAIYTRWAASTATAWLAGSRAATLRTPMRIGLGLGALTFGSLYATWTLAVAATVGHPDIVVLVFLFLNPLSVVPVVAATAYPLYTAVRVGSGRVRDVLLDAPTGRVLRVPRVRPLLVLAPGLLIAGVYLLADGLVFQGLALNQIFALGRAPTGTGLAEAANTRQVLALLFAMTLGELGAVAMVALVLLVRPVQAVWAHLFTTAVAAGLFFTPAFVAIPVAKPCFSGQCQVLVVAQTVGVVPLVATLIAPIVALPWWLVVTAVARWRGSTPDRGEAGRIGRGRGRWAAAVGAALALAYALPVTWVLAFVLNLIFLSAPVVAPDVRDAPVETVATDTGTVCGRYNRLLVVNAALQTDELAQVSVAGAARLTTDSPVLRDVGAVRERAYRQGDPERVAQTALALNRLCAGYPPLTPPS